MMSLPIPTPIDHTVALPHGTPRVALTEIVIENATDPLDMKVEVVADREEVLGVEIEIARRREESPVKRLSWKECQ